MIKLKLICITGGVLLLLIISVQYLQLYDGKLHISFCDVGQGDAIFIRTPGRQKLLVDGGPNSQVLKCLDNQLPFWDRTITAVVLTHPHYDHFRGLIDVLHRYTVQFVGQEDLQNKSLAFETFARAVEEEHTNALFLKKGTKIQFRDGVAIEIFGPDPAFLAQENPDGVTESENPPSLIIHVKYGSFDLLLPGDSDGEDLVKYLPSPFTPDVLALPHHGSENGFTEAAATFITPHIAIASSGKGNRYGHPHIAVLSRMRAKHTQVLRTDQHGTITMSVSKNGEVTIHTQR